MIKRLFGLGEPPEITLVADRLLGRRDDPAKVASAVGVTWSPSLQKEWDARYARCSGCQVWIKGKRSIWCEVCGAKGL